MNEEEIMEEYDDLRARKEDEKQKRVLKVYSEYPEIKEIDRKIYLYGAENVKNIIKNPSKSDELNKEYKNKLKILSQKREDIIKSNGIDPLFDSVKYECEKCCDTGFLKNGKRCECLNKKIILYRYGRSNLSDILERENFDTFSFKYYSKKISGKRQMSPYDNMKIIYSRAKKFCENFDNEEKGLIFYGAAGLGKTFLSSCIAKDLMDRGKTVIYMSAPRLFMIYDEYRFNRLDDESIIDDIYSSDLLIIDDLGTEAQNKNNLSFLFDLMNERLESGKKIIINTNYGMDYLARMYTPRFTSRVYEYFLVYGFYGSDIRIEKLKNKE